MPKLRLTRRAEEVFRSLSPSAQQTLDAALLRLTIDPEAAGCELLGTLRGTWRMREGGYRVLYKIKDGGHLVVVQSIRLRRQGYPKGRR